MWGNGRKMRAPEIVLAVLNDPTKTDPLASIVYKRLADARRLLNKSPNRLHFAIHTFESMERDGDKRTIFWQKQGPIAGMKQAALLLGGQLHTDQNGFSITHDHAQAPLAINAGTDTEWKINSKQAIVRAITAQLSDRLLSPDSEEEGGEQEDRRLQRPVDRVLPVVPSGTTGAPGTPQHMPSHGTPEAAIQPREESHPSAAASSKAKKKKGRKDLYGILNAVDTFATNALTQAKGATLLKRHNDILEEAGLQINASEIRDDPVQQHRYQSVIAGSVRAYDRLYEAELIEDKKCMKCGSSDASLRHVAWECQHWAKAREPYSRAVQAYIEKVAGSDVHRQRRIMALATNPCVHNCGVMLESQYFLEGGAPLPAGNARYQQPNSDIQDPMGNLNSNLEKDDEGRILVYTDGTACNPDDHRRRRVAWATYYAHEHPWNCSGPVEGGLQTVYRAELIAVNHAIQAATRPIHIVSDCLFGCQQCC